MVKVKICGITNEKDALAATGLGADFLGFNFFQKSPRYIAPAKAKEMIKFLNKRIKTVGIFVNEHFDHINTIAKYCGADLVQLHGDETPDFCEKIKFPIIKAFRVGDDGVFKQIELFNTDYILLDTFSEGQFGGTGQSIAQEFLPVIKELAKKRKIFLSGGLNAENVHRLVSEIQPFGVDVASGVELSPGIKGQEKMKEFIEETRR